MTPDPLSEKYYGVSPYAFCNNDPVNFVDPNGKIVGTLSGAILGAFFGGIKAYKKGENIKKGIVSGAVSGSITGAAVDLTVASGGTLGVVFGASVIGGTIGGVAGEAIGSAVANESTTTSDLIEAGYNGAVAGADDVRSVLPNAPDDVVSDISKKIIQSEQQALKNVDKRQVCFEAFAEITYFIIAVR